uniref:Succinate dehydrogenase subunit 3 n=1 Tax=Jakoba bahamiensis TaxID=221721 RepID=M4QD38_9EUKA|nr:succinate dehydrogenase subunit 3 [Jakoba bahamiensis]AGH24105.1 succinate dehydrogenase subunit 3 [Jakoba bahamiensis]
MVEFQINTRPISPHITIYKMPLTATLSILHRITGGVLSVGLFVFLLMFKFLMFHLSSYYSYQFFYYINMNLYYFWSFIGYIVLLFFSYHLFAGIRHLIWDLGIGLDLKDIYRSGYLILGLTFFSSLVLWLIY